MIVLLFIASLWPPAGKKLTSWLLFVMVNGPFVTFPCGILGQVWLIVSIPDRCCLLTLHMLNNSIGYLHIALEDAKPTF